MLVRKKYGLWRKIKFAFFAIVLIGGAIYIVFYSPAFKIESVNVAIAGYDEEKLSGLIGPDPRGGNLIFWSPVHVPEQYPEIKDLEISKDYSHRSIEITGSLRDKKMVWCFRSGADSPASPRAHQGGCFWIDETGYIFTEAPNIEGGALIVINDSRPDSLQVGETVLPSVMFKNLNTILNILTELKLGIADINIQDLKLREFIVNLEKGQKLIFSLEGNPAFVRPALNSLIKSATWGKTKTVNLTVEGRVYQGF